MYPRILFLPFLLMILSLACNKITGLGLENNATPTIGPLEDPVVPQSLPTLQSIQPTEGVAVPTSELPLPTQPQVLKTQTPVEEKIDPEAVQYEVHSGSINAMENFYYPDLGCSWMGVGGQVIGESGQPVGMLVVEVGGVLSGEEVGALTLTGSATQWGPGGYEFSLADKPVQSTGSLWIQLFDLEATPLSQKIYLETYENCDQAVLVVNFTHVSLINEVYLPVIQQNP